MTAHRRPIPDVANAAKVTIDVRHGKVPPSDIVVVGAGGHGRELVDIVRSVAQASGTVSLVGVCDDGEADRLLLARSGIRFLGARTALEHLDADVHLGLGYPAVRREIDIALGYRPAVPLVHPTATTGSSSALADGVVIAQQTVVTTNVRLGRHTHINVSASISHDCVLGNYVTVCPGATITGSVTIDDLVFVGAGATIMPGVRIGAGATIGAGAVVTTDVLPGRTVVGIPAAPLP